MALVTARLSSRHTSHSTQSWECVLRYAPCGHALVGLACVGPRDCPACSVLTLPSCGLSFAACSHTLGTDHTLESPVVKETLEGFAMCRPLLDAATATAASVQSKLVLRQTQIG